MEHLPVICFAIASIILSINLTKRNKEIKRLRNRIDELREDNLSLRREVRVWRLKDRKL